MSVESEILRIQHNIADTYAKVSEKGGDVPLQPNSANLAAAVASIPEGGSAVLVKAPIGTIVIWSGTADNIPSGWQVCDGTNGTPDLRDKFVLGAGTKHGVGNTGGSEEVTLTVGQMPSHYHQVESKFGEASTGANTLARTISNTSVIRSSTASVGGSEPHPNMPPYYALCYIMKLTADQTDGVTMEQVNSAIDTKLDAYTPEEVYSTEETRIGTWIDGKPLYRKVVLYQNINLTTTVGSVSVSIPNEIFEITKRSLTAQYTTNSGKTISLELPYVVYVGSSIYYLQEYIDLSDHTMFLNWKFSENDTAIIKATLEYTKTTDQPQTIAANTVLKPPASNSIPSAAVTASSAAGIEI